MKGWIGLAFIVLGLVIMFLAQDRNNDKFWYSRPYTVITKHQSEHQYKGRYNPDYYLTVKYDDEPNMLTTKEFSGASYYSQNIGDKRAERTANGLYHKMFWVMVIMVLIGLAFLFKALDEAFETDFADDW